jgi:hypothetical protein
MRKIKRLLARFFLNMAGAGGWMHINIQYALGRLPNIIERLGDANVRQYQRGVKFFIGLYEKFRNGNNNRNHKG